MHFRTQAIHAGPKADPAYGAVVPPLYQVSTFQFPKAGEKGPFDYSRSGNPTRQLLEDTLAALDGGARALAFATGMAAETTVLTLLQAGDHLLVHDDLYGGTYRLFTQVATRQGIIVQFVDMRDLSALAAAFRPNTRMLWCESVTNPLMQLVDLPEIAQKASQRGVLSVVDNTFLSPYFLRPLAMGFDLVLHSTTKYINGHSDVVGGAVVARDASVGEQLYRLQNTMGTCASPFDSLLVLRGLRTLPLRMDAHHEGAVKVARFLEAHPRIAAVLHPSLESHPQHALGLRLAEGWGGTFSFRVRGGRQEAYALLDGCRVFTVAESLGGVESLIEHPATMTHASMPESVRNRLGITEDLVRVSVGIEHPDDLISDLQSALSRS